MHMNPKCLIFTILLMIESLGLTVSAQMNPALTYHSKKHVTCRKGAVVSAHPLASLAGIQMLKQGGNAVDAAIATQLALAVVYPGAGNIGGGGFMVARLANGSNITIDFREKAPAGAYRNM
jgi:gamma-glutamyltranspeptidase/glutathione hydrolase